MFCPARRKGTKAIDGLRNKDQSQEVILLVEEKLDHDELIRRMFEVNEIPNSICHGYLVKPVGSSQFRQVIRSLFTEGLG